MKKCFLVFQVWETCTFKNLCVLVCPCEYEFMLSIVHMWKSQDKFEHWFLTLISFKIQSFFGCKTTTSIRGGLCCSGGGGVSYCYSSYSSTLQSITVGKSRQKHQRPCYIVYIHALLFTSTKLTLPVLM